MWETIKNSVWGGCSWLNILFKISWIIFSVWVTNFTYVLCITNIRHTQRKLGNWGKVEKNCVSNKRLVTPGSVPRGCNCEVVHDKCGVSTAGRNAEKCGSRASCGGMTVKYASSVPLRGLYPSVLVGCLYCLYMQYCDHSSSLEDVEM